MGTIGMPGKEASIVCHERGVRPLCNNEVPGPERSGPGLLLLRSIRLGGGVWQITQTTAVLQSAASRLNIPLSILPSGFSRSIIDPG